MAAQLVPIRLSVTAGDLYTFVGTPLAGRRGRMGGLSRQGRRPLRLRVGGRPRSVRRTDTDNDLTDHPAWPKLAAANAHKFEPAESQQADLVAVAELLSDKPTKESVDALAQTLAVVSSLGSVCDLPTVTRFFNGNPNLGWVTGGRAVQWPRGTQALGNHRRDRRP